MSIYHLPSDLFSDLLDLIPFSRFNYINSGPGGVTPDYINSGPGGVTPDYINNSGPGVTPDSTIIITVDDVVIDCRHYSNLIIPKYFIKKTSRDYSIRSDTGIIWTSNIPTIIKLYYSNIIINKEIGSYFIHDKRLDKIASANITRKSLNNKFSMHISTVILDEWNKEVLNLALE